jgi:ketosteroid isomerase-like protein
MKFRLVSASVLETRTQGRRGPEVVRNERLVRAYVDAVVRRDFEAARVLCAPDMRMQATEPDGTSAEVEGFDETLAFSMRRVRAFGLSVRYQVVDSLSAGDRVALLFAPTQAEDGRPVAPQRVAVYTVKNGLIRSLRVYDGPTT